MSLVALVAAAWSHVDFYSLTILLVVYWLTRFVIWHGYIFSRKNLPPGFFGFPLVDVVPYFYFGKQTFFERLESFGKKYGPVVRYRRGKDTMVVVTGVQAVREGMLNDDLLGRPPQPLEDVDKDSIFVKKSVLNIEGDLWKKHRRFSLVTLRDLGFGKTAIMEDRIQDEVRDFITRVEAEGGQPLNVHSALVESTGNNINSLVFGGTFDAGNNKKQRIYQFMTDINSLSESLFKVLFIPFAMKIMKKLNIGIMKRFNAVTDNLTTFITDDIQSHKDDLDRDNPRDYVDHYLMEQERDEEFTEELVLGNAVAFFFAGSGTVRLTLEYLFQLMAHRPEIQRKVQTELDELTGRSREVTWADSQDLAYTMAVIAERHRYCTVAPSGVPRKVLRPTKLCGYDLQTDEQVVFSIDSVHYDPGTFENPYEFRPERFIDEKGKLFNTEKVWSFSIGKRACPGESLAVLEVFLYFARVLQNFTIEPVGPVQFRPLRSLLSETIPQELRFVRRS